jgi:hypothetical protein
VRRSMAGAGLAVALALITAVPAHAVRVTAITNETTGIVGIFAEPGDVNALTVTGLPPDPELANSLNPSRAGSVLIRDTTATITTDSDLCRVIDAHTARCEAAAEPEFGEGLPPEPTTVEHIRVRLEDRSDRVTIPVHSSELFLDGDGGSGNDVLENKSTLSGWIDGGTGDDRIVMRGSGGGRGALGPSIAGGSGNDVFDVRNLAPADEVQCGDDYDVVDNDPGDTAFDCEEIHTSPVDGAPLRCIQCTITNLLPGVPPIPPR